MFYSKRLRRFVFLAIVLIVCSSCAKRASGPMKASSPPANFAFLGKPTSDITFLSTQMNPVEEAGKMRNAILKDFPGKVDFRPNDNSYIFNQIDSLLQADPSKSILMGATHGDLVGLYERNALRPLDDLFARLEHDRKFSNQLLDLCRLNGKNIYYVPWMQATFVMVANKKALPYIPKGVELDFLTYDQLRQWAKNIHDKTGMTALGFPAGKNGLMHRFFQGYLYPSFTASTLLKFRSPEAKAMWEYFRDLWTLVHPGSLVYSTMAEPLLTGEVWIAWDHTARFMKAFKERPDDFVAFPTPIGPRGRGFIAVVSGLSIPLGSADIANQAMLIDYLTRAEIQTKTLNEVGFFPAVAVGADSAIPRHLQELSSAVDMQANDRYSIPVLLPQGLGVRGGDYNNLFMLTFSEIVLRGKPPTQVLNENAAELQRILDEQNARCWLPDTSDARPCKIE